MPRTKSLELENERREQLLFATYTVFAQQGFAETSLADIAAAAEFSKAMVIYYFKSKENLLVAAFEWITSGILDRLQTCCLSQDSAVPMLRAQLEQLFMSTRRNRRFYQVYLDFLAQSVHNDRLGSVTGRFYAGLHRRTEPHNRRRGRGRGVPPVCRSAGGQFGLRRDDGWVADAMAVR